MVQVDLADDNSSSVGELGTHFTPRIDQHGMAVGASPVNVRPALRGREYVSQILDRTGAQ